MKPGPGVVAEAKITKEAVVKVKFQPVNSHKQTKTIPNKQAVTEVISRLTPAKTEASPT